MSWLIVGLLVSNLVLQFVIRNVQMHDMMMIGRNQRTIYEAIVGDK